MQESTAATTEPMIGGRIAVTVTARFGVIITMATWVAPGISDPLGVCTFCHGHAVVSCIISPRSSIPNKRTRFRCHPLYKIRFASPPALSSHPVIPLFPSRHPFLAMATKRLGVAKTESNGREAADAKSALLKLIEWASQMNMYGTTSQLHTRGSFSSSLALLSLPLSASLTSLYISSHSPHLVPSLTNVLSSCVFVMCVWSR